MKHINEYLLGKNNNNVKSSSDPSEIFKRLNNGKMNKTRFNIHNIINTIENFLDMEIFTEYVKCILNILDKAIDDGYVLDYRDLFSSGGYYKDSNDDKTPYTENTKLLHFFGHLNDILEFTFINFERLITYKIDMFYGGNLEVYTYKFKNFKEMTEYVSRGGIDDKRLNISNPKELEQSINKYLDI